MSEIKIRLDRSKPFGECRGDRTPEDPHYRVAHFQGQTVNGKIVTLPFDSAGELIPDDGKTESWQGIGPDGKPITYFPLYTKDMRELLERKKARMAKSAIAAPEKEPEKVVDEDDDDDVETVDDVNIESWLRGEARYPADMLRTAARTRFGKVYKDTRDMVVELVLDEKLIPEDQVAPAFRQYLPKQQAA